MGSRSDWLTDFAKPVADDLAARSGSLKHVLSAGVMALAGCTAELREYYMARAMGAEIDIQAEEARIARILIKVLRGDRNGHLSAEDQAFLESVGQLLAADSGEPAEQEAVGRNQGKRKPSKAG